ncbi:molybdopterin molybdotransferase MoeA [Demequina sp.]|uniref:molybdopterin molybdotransferase MoeA n=1 Tax=Demequina sp. TaxID=2050685 RepID=UPI003D139550
MTTVAQHRAALTELLGTVEAIDLALGDALGAVTAEDVSSPQPYPAIPQAAADGYAIASNDALHPVALPVAYDVDSSERTPRVLVRGTAVRITSGSPMPRGADAVAATADTDGGVGTVQLSRSILRGENVRRAGFDATAGEIIVPAGRRIGPRELGLIAAIGRARIKVRPVPRVVVVAIGSELVDAKAGVEGVPEANTHMLSALVQDAGARAYRVGALPDDPAAIAAALEDQVVRADAIITTGGLSASGSDALVDVLSTIGTGELVDLNLLPRSRHGIGRIAEGNTPVIALPGHPASALIAFEAYARPALRAMSGFTEVQRVTIRAELSKPWPSTRGAMEAVPVTLELDGDGIVRATPLGDGRGGVSLGALARSDGIAWIGADVTNAAVGDEVRCTVWDR